ncbi:MAG: Ferric transporter ATP-binding subunit [Dehalococcoidia bacterium]|nr:Ferric transporter ATP-binding subunit [Dehalococcoidia bacterium]
MKNKRFHLIWPVVLLVLLVSCTPKATPVPTPAATTAPPFAPVSVPTSNISPLTSQNAAWAKVIEAAKKEGRLVIYGDTVFANAGREMTAAFNAQYGIPVDVLVLAGRQTLEKIKVEQAIRQPVVDVAQTGVTTGTEIVLSGLAESPVSVLPELRDRSVFYLDPVYGPQEQIIGIGVTCLGILINTNLVKPGEIKSWYDVLDPKWKGKMIMADPRGTGTGLNIFSTLTYHKVLDYDYFRKLAEQKPALWGGSSREMELMVGRGEYPVLFGIGSSVEPLIMEGAPLKLVDPVEGSTAQFEQLTMIKGAPHPNAAKLFINWLLSKEGQTVYNKTVSRLPLRKDLPDYTAEKLKRTYSKLWNRTWEAAEQSNKDLKSGIVEQIFGKK